MNIVLIGYRCSGKTVVGKILARDLGRDFLDTDEKIEENTGSSIETIISREGWNHFRDVEKRVIEEVSSRDHLVISTGGGVVVDRGNRENLKRNGWLVWLEAEAQVIKDRMEREHRSGKIRPSLTGTDPLDEIKGVLNTRLPLYQEAGDFMVDTSFLSTREAAARILKALPNGLKG
ncbi:MAG: shikimate kinase [Desulfatiglandales bacterium]|jgi:shikimate kinase|nr:shikimate kinase [Desulfatiglandales bacterium]